MSRKRVAFGVAAVLLIGASVFGGAMAAQAAPTDAPVITLPITGPDPDAQPQVEGDVTENGLRVSVSVTNSGGTSLYCSDPTADIATGFSCVGAPLPFGVNEFFATAQYASGLPDAILTGPSNLVEYTHWDPSGHVEILTGPAASSGDSTVSFSGTGPALGTVALYESLFYGDQVCQTNILADGTWQCDLAFTVPPGSYEVTIFAGGTFFFNGSGPVINDTGGPWAFGITPLGPTMEYVFGPGSISVTATATATGDPTNGVSTRLYKPTPIPGDPFVYGPALDGCPGTATGVFGAAQEVCDYTVADYGLGTGIWNMFSGQQVNGFATVHPTDYQNDFAFIPDAPTLSATPNTNLTITLSGTGTAGYSIDVVDGAGTTPLCTTTVQAGGAWSCTMIESVGNHSYRSTQQSVGFDAGDFDATLPASSQSFDGYSVYSATVNAFVPPALIPIVPAPSPTPSPTVTPIPEPPLVWTLDIGGATEVLPGDSVVLSGLGLPVGSAVSAEFHSVVVALGSTTVGSGGSFSIGAVVPLDAVPGPHEFVVTVTPVGKAPSPASQSITVLEPVKILAGPPEKTDLVDAGGPGEGASGTDRDDPGAPSSFTHAIETFQQIFSNPVVVGTAAAAGIALLLFVAFPAELLNSTLAEQYQRIQRRLPPVKVGWFARFRHWLDTTPLFGGILITFLAAFIFGFADPGFGFDITSARVVLACFIALFFVGYVASAVAGLIIRRREQLPTVMELKPLGIALTVLGVIASRLLDFSPGFLIGLILGITLAGQSTVANRAKAALVQTSVIFAFAVLAWVGYSLISGTVQSDTFGGALLFDTLVALTTEGLTAVFIGLLPFKYFEGAAIFANSKLIWIASYVVAAFAFLAIVVPAANNWGDVGMSLPLWIGIVGAFFVIAIAVYLIFRFWVKDDADNDDEESAPASITSDNDRA